MKNPTPSLAGSGFPRFVVAQVTSWFGTTITGFALGVWVYLTTGSVTRFALISFFTLLPGLVLAPIAGALVDRWDLRWTLALSDLGSGLCSLLVAVLLWQHALQIWHIYVLMALSSALGAPQTLAFNASIPLLVNKSQLSRANGIFQLGLSAAEVGAPLIAGLLVARWGISTALMVDFLTCVVAIGSVLSIRLPKRERIPTVGTVGKRSLLAEAAEGWTFIRTHPGLLALMWMFTALNFARGSVVVLVTPMVLAFNSAQVLGQVFSISALGMVLGGLAMTLWGGPKRRMLGIFASMLVYSVMLFLGSLRADVVLITVSAFFVALTGPFINGLGVGLWHVKVPSHLQGRVTAMRRTFSWSAVPLSALVAGPFADRVFEPLMAKNGPLAGSVGHLIGSGRGRGVALFLSLQAIGILVLLIVCLLYRPLRRLEEETPDMDVVISLQEAEAM
jgi:MFS family permease